MDERKKLILKEIVDRYIKTGEPVSSQTLLQEYPMRVSSATVRNDMKYLEKHGYITKWWSSSGRIPTTKGYRFFVDWLVELSDLAKREQHAIIESYEFQRQELDDLLHKTAFLLSNLTGYLGYVLSPRLEETELESITLARLDPVNVLVVIISNLGIIENRVIRSSLAAEDLKAVQTLLNGQLRGRRLREVQSQALAAEVEGWGDPLVQEAWDLLRGLLEKRLRRRLYVEGTLNLLRTVFTWEDGLAQAQSILAFLEDEERFSQALEGLDSGRGRVSAMIGEENYLPELHHFALIGLSYGYSGVLGVLGPVRTDYSRVFSTTQYVGNRLSAIMAVTHRAAELV